MESYSTYVGLDVHAETISACGLGGGLDGGELFLVKLPADADAVARLIGTVAKRGKALFCYEAGPCGYGLQRRIAAAGQDCLVVAPSLIPRKPGERVKTDTRDARKLARNLRAGELEAVWVPGPAHEAMRDLVRARHQAQRARKAAMQRVSSFLLRQGRRWPARPWTLKHKAWLKAQEFAEPAHGFLFCRHLDALADADAEVKRFEVEIVARLGEFPAGKLVAALRALRGIDLISAVTLAAAIGDPRRFASAPAFMAYVGLVPCEHSSGGKRRTGGITKTGDNEARRVLIEAAWCHRTKPAAGAAKRALLAAQPQAIRAIAKACETRLHRRLGRFLQARKKPQIAATAIAREQAGFVWALAREVGAPLA